MTTTLSKVILKEFQETNFQSFSDGQITINFPDENDLTRVDIVLTPKGSPYAGGTFTFRVNLPSNYPESVASINCTTKIFHPNIDFTGHICFNLLNDEWNPQVRLVDYAHGLLWLLYQPNLSSRLNGSVPNDQREYEKMVLQSLQGKSVAGQGFPRFIEPPFEANVDDAPIDVAQRIAMFNAPRPPPPPPLNFRMRIPTATTQAAPQAVVVDTVPVVPPTFTAPVAAPPPLPLATARRVQPTTIAGEEEEEVQTETRQAQMDLPVPPARVLRRSTESLAWTTGPSGSQIGLRRAKKHRGGRRGNSAAKLAQRRRNQAATN